jgi:FG-GAP-like repeat
MSLIFSITNYPTGINPISVAVGDLNGDGQLDLVTANIGGDPAAPIPPDGTVSVLLGSGGGTFSAATTNPTGSVLAFSVAIGDLNGDGKLDLAVANYGDPMSGNPGGTISIFLGDGDGTFSAATPYSTLTGLAGAQSVAIGDLNGDGKLDLAVADASNRVPILLGNGDGTFNVQTPLTFSGLNNNGSIAIADLNGDGRLDLALTNFGTDLGSGAGTTVSVLLGQVGGGFSNRTLTTGTNPSSVAIGDLNGDGRLDLAVANAGSNTVSVLLGNGDGTFQAQTQYATGTNPESVAIGDLNGDGRLDLAVANYDSNTVSVLLGNVGGGFQAQTQYPTGTNPASVAIRDLNGDGRLDLAVANAGSNNVTVLLNDIAPTITSNGGGDTATISIAENITAVTAVMATDPDAGQTLSYSISGGADAAKFTIGSLTGVLSFVTAPNFELPTDAGGNNVYDVIVQASDGLGGIDTQALAVTVTDVVENAPPIPPVPPGTTADMILRRADGTYEIYDIGNNSILAAAQLGQVGTDWKFVGLGGFFGGDTTDMLLRSSTTGGFEVYDISNNQITGAAFLGTVGMDWQVMGFGDFNGDAKTDMALRNVNTGGIETYNISNNQIVGASFLGTVGLNWQFSGIGDFNGDGQADLMLRNSTTGGLEVYNIANNQIVNASFMGAVGLNWQFSGIGDFNGDGASDMMLRNANTGGLEVYDIANNQITGAAFLGTVGLNWQFAGVAPVRGAGTSDLVLRDINTGQFEVYNIANDQIVGAALLGTVGLDWQLGGFAADPPTASGAFAGGATDQLVQAMAGFGGGSGAAHDLNAVALGSDTSQQPLLTTPQHG